MAKTNKYTGPILTKFLREMAQEEVTVGDDGSPETRAKRLAKIVWEHALGTYPDLKKPAQWAIELVYDRMEGRIAQAMPLDVNKRPMSEKIGDIARKTINALSETATSRTVPAPPGCVDRPDNGAKSPERPA